MKSHDFFRRVEIIKRSGAKAKRTVMFSNANKHFSEQIIINTHTNTSLISNETLTIYPAEPPAEVEVPLLRKVVAL
jgi:hypothetical protein